MAANFPKLVTDTRPRIQDARGTGTGRTPEMHTETRRSQTAGNPRQGENLKETAGGKVPKP